MNLRSILDVAKVTAIGLGFFLLASICPPVHAATNAPSQFESPPPVRGSVQWEVNRDIARQRQETYRKRLSLPGAVAANVPAEPDANLAFNSKKLASPATAAPATPIAATTPGILLEVFFMGAVIFVGGILILWRTSPQVIRDFNHRHNPWLLQPVTGEMSGGVRSEDEAFAGFLAEFQKGPSAAPEAAAAMAKDSINPFFARAADHLRTCRKMLKAVEESDGAARQKLLANFYFEMGAMKEGAAPVALPLWQMTSALEGLLKQLLEKIRNVTPSTLRAVAGGLDLLETLSQPGATASLSTEPMKFLVVDDDLISRQALSLALKKAFGQPDLAVDGESALAQTAAQFYDVIFLDVQMPGMDGFELCTKIRSTTINRRTPVIFVTAVSDFDARAQSTFSGGNDLMGKPFLIFEVTVKALTLALQGRLQGRTLENAIVMDKTVAATKSPLHISDFPVTLAALVQTPESDEFNKAFLSRASANLGALQRFSRAISQTTGEEARQNLLAEGFLHVNSLIAKNGVEVIHPAYQVCTALEALLKKMLQDTKNSTASALASMTAAIELLADLCAAGVRPDLAVNPPVQLLVVDDDFVARRVLVGALQTVFAKPDSAENGEAALVLAAEKSFDVIFLDVVMPGMDGFEACTKIRETAANRFTPVIFVTGQDDPETRAQMGRSGGNDLMGKPFLNPEINLKALTFALRHRLDEMKLLLSKNL